MSGALLQLAQNLRHFRVVKKLTQDELAKISGVNRSYLASLESGSRKNSSVRTVEKLAAALDISVSDLFRSSLSQNKRGGAK
jgi:transcriptional regulator with XRE-family HTH domain